MTRAFRALVYAAVLALLAAHGVAVSARVDAPASVVQCAEFRRQIAQKESQSFVRRCEPLCSPTYVSLTRSQPELAILFQRPPPDAPVLS
jgi:hypothetical protein